MRSGDRWVDRLSTRNLALLTVAVLFAAAVAIWWLWDVPMTWGVYLLALTVQILTTSVIKTIAGRR